MIVPASWQSNRVDKKSFLASPGAEGSLGTEGSFRLHSATAQFNHLGQPVRSTIKSNSPSKNFLRDNKPPNAAWHGPTCPPFVFAAFRSTSCCLLNHNAFCIADTRESPVLTVPHELCFAELYPEGASSTSICATRLLGAGLHPSTKLVGFWTAGRCSADGDGAGPKPHRSLD
jgi:hypothetical protein